MTHPVNAFGIMLALEKLGLLEVVHRDLTRAALVFVVLKEKERDFKRQEIVSAATGCSPVKSIKGIGPVTERMLAAREIHTVG
ncbi:hypothetical protein GN958_ATG00886 [Phytophthora infestans]|uniref:Uncharacterized protein n=1 Tax=Phytophthora infestans TaxID=4787 RepID=A0A8S9VCL1_PHYIN|nr:hypothetical protein GN958_ATG00886 [Phytophthora infestans]